MELGISKTTRNMVIDSCYAALSRLDLSGIERVRRHIELDKGHTRGVEIPGRWRPNAAPFATRSVAPSLLQHARRGVLGPGSPSGMVTILEITLLPM